jgi:hypothetical protein
LSTHIKSAFSNKVITTGSNANRALLSNINKDNLADVRDMLKNYSKLDKEHKERFEGQLRFTFGDIGDKVIDILSKRDPTSKDIGEAKQSISEVEVEEQSNESQKFSVNSDKESLIPNEDKKSPNKQQVGNELKQLADAFNSLSKKEVQELVAESTKLLNNQKEEEQNKSFGDKVKSMFKSPKTEQVAPEKGPGLSNN